MRLLLEFTEFNAMRMNSDSVPQSTHVDNPDLSMDGFSQFDANLRDSLKKLNHMYSEISRGGNLAVNLRSGESVDISDLKNIKILRIFPKDDIYLNVYFTFELGGKEYYGVIERINSTRPEVTSEIFRDINIQSNREWIIRVKGNLVKVIKNWMNPEEGYYISLKDIDGFDETTGNMVLIPEGSKIKLIRMIGDDSLLINFNEIDYILRGKNYFYFNYYFSPDNSSSDSSEEEMSSME